jgi:hypothetical protein
MLRKGKIVTTLALAISFIMSLFSAQSLVSHCKMFLYLLSQAAARRVAHYWKCRRDIIFGNRAFLPVTLAGAMTEDLETLEKGLLSVPPSDQHGRCVVYWHRTRMNRTLASRCSIVSCPPTPDPTYLYRLQIMLWNKSIFRDVLLTPVSLSSFLLLS